MTPCFLRFGSCLALLGWMICNLAIADVTPEVQPFVDLFESRYRAAHTLQATFLERYTEGGRDIRVESGIAYFRRPGKMRWEYQAPENNLFLVDGKNAWFYVPADHTATRIPAKASTDWRTPLALLAGEMKVSRVCSHVQAAPAEKMESPGDIMLNCKFRGDASRSPNPSTSATRTLGEDAAEAVYFEIAKKTGELVVIKVSDPGGVGIEFHFTGWRVDPPVDDSFFHFRALPGVAIVNGELPAPNGGARP